MKLTDKHLIASRPKHHRANAAFTRQVMARIAKSEILRDSLRNMNVTKKETFMKRLKRLPLAAVVAIIFGLTLLLSGGAYAAYQLLWPKPEVHVSAPQTSTSGRTEVTIDYAQCGSEFAASRYELKKNATITADQIPGVLKARCEMAAISTWAQATFPHDDRMMRDYKNTQPYESTMVNAAMPTHIKAKENGSIIFEGLTKYNQVDKTYEVSKDIRYVADGRDVNAGDIKVGDPVIYITSEKQKMTPKPGCDENHCSISGENIGSTLLAVVKLSQPFEYYDQFAWQSLIEKTTCTGNEADNCLMGYIGGIDLYTDNNVPYEGKMHKEIQGVITEINGKKVTIKSSSGRLFTITTSTDIVSSYNANRASSYNNQTVTVGKNLAVSYLEPADVHSQALGPDNLAMVTLLLEMVGKSDAPTAY